ncbi:succinylglutamate desuccinylase [Micromonospora inaquosa]|uniref:Succinylglutamate desuccinylase n=1 Tax=Micromonospora inaquosa TaxID=2203716 RepID=A0A3N9WXK8_9ACTN|nr:succinylglutamate desuccinylase [Micromonospora inaquosa]
MKDWTVNGTGSSTATRRSNHSARRSCRRHIPSPPEAGAPRHTARRAAPRPH